MVRHRVLVSDIVGSNPAAPIDFLLPDRLTVGRQILDLSMLVRFQLWQLCFSRKNVALARRSSSVEG